MFQFFYLENFHKSESEWNIRIKNEQKIWAVQWVNCSAWAITFAVARFKPDRYQA